MTIQGIFLAAVVLGLAAWLYSVRWAKREITPRRRFILMGIRIAFLISLVALWYRPTVARVKYEEQPPHVAIVLDDSDSMNIQDVPADGPEPVTSRAWWASETVFQEDTGLVDVLRDRGSRVTVHAMADGRVYTKPTTYRANKTASDLTGGVRELSAPRRTSRPDAIVLISDGAENVHPSPVLPNDLSVPVHTLGVGDPELQVDLRLEGVSLPRNVFREEPVQALATVIRSGQAPAEFRLRVQEGDEILEERLLRFEEGTDRKVVDLDLEFAEEGERILHFEVETEAPERITRNNRVSERILVLKDKHQVVGLLGAPSLETKYLFRALDQDIRLETRLLYMLPQGVILDPMTTGGDKITTRDALWNAIAEADLVVAANLGDSGLTEADAQRLYAYVAEEGGDLLWLGGRRSFGSVVVETQLARLFPFEIPGDFNSRGRSAQLRVTSVGLRSPGFEALAQVGGQRLPPLTEIRPLQTVHPGSRVSLQTRDTGPASDGDPVYITQRYGLGNIAVLLGTGTWRWQATFAGTPEDDPRATIHSRFWQGVVHGFFAGPDTGDLRIEANGATFEVHETVSVWTYLDEQTASWYDDPNIIGTLARTDEDREVRIPLNRSSQNSALYEGRFSLPASGAYTFSAAVGEREGTLSLTARASGEEFAVLNQQRDHLERIAGETNGRYFSREEWTEIPGALTLESEEVARRSRIFLGQLPEIVLLVLGLAIAEWILRRRWSLP